MEGNVKQISKIYWKGEKNHLRFYTSDICLLIGILVVREKLKFDAI